MELQICEIDRENLYIYSAYQNKFTLFKSPPHINILKYFQEISIHVGSYRCLL